MLISRLALSLFWFPGVCPLRLEYFHIPQKDYGFLFLFSLFNFQGPVRSLFFCQALDYFITFRCVCQELFSEVFRKLFRKELFNSITSFDVCQELFCSHFRGTFLFYHNQSRFVKIFFRSVERLTILPRLLPPVNAFFCFFSLFFAVCEIRTVFLRFHLFP